MICSAALTLLGFVGAGCGEQDVVPVPGLLVVSPQAIDFGAVPIGFVTRARIELQNRGESPLAWQAELDPDSPLTLSVTEGRLRPGDSIQVEVGLLPTRAGPLSLPIRWISDSKTQPEVLTAVSAVVLPELLALSPAHIDFGPVRTETLARRTATLRNYSPEPVQVSMSLQSQSDALRLRGPTTLTLPARAQVQLELEFTPMVEGHVQATLRIEGDCTLGCTVVAPVSAHAVPASLVCTPQEVDFGFTNLGNCQYRSLSCVNIDTAFVEATDLTLDPDSAIFNVDHPQLPVTLASGEALVMTLGHCPEQTVRDTSLVTLDTHERDGQTRRTTVRLRGQGGGPNIEVSPGLVYFGPVVLGTQRTRTVQVFNRGDAPLTLSGGRVEPAGPAFTWLDAGPQPVAPGQALTLTLQYAPQSVGAERAELVLLSDDPDQPRTGITLEAEGLPEGLCRARMQPGAYSFGLVDVGGSSEATLELFAEDAPCRWSDPRVEGDAAFSLVSRPARSGVLAPGAALPFRVRYASPSPSPADGHLAVFRIDVPHATPDQLQVPLTGQTIDSDLIIWPESIDFGLRPMGQSHHRTVFIFNTGTGPHALTDFVLEGAPADLQFSTATRPILLRANESMQVQLTWAPQQETRLETNLTFRSDQLPAVRLQVRGQAKVPTTPRCGHIEGDLCVSHGGWPAVGAEVRIQSGTGPELAVQADENGHFFAHCVPEGTATLTAQRGHFTHQRTVRVQRDQTSTVPQTCLSPPPAGQVAVITGLFDRVNAVLDRALVGYVVHSGLHAPPALLRDHDLLMSYDVVFLACGSDDLDARDPEVAANLRAFVLQGGSLYVSDLAYNALEAAFPEAVDFVGDDAVKNAAHASWGAPITMQARVLSPELMRVAQLARLPLSLDLPYVRVQSAQSAATTVLAAPTGGPTDGLKPLSVVYRPTGTSGTIVYTTVHEAAQLAPALRRILEDLIYRL